MAEPTLEQSLFAEEQATTAAPAPVVSPVAEATAPAPAQEPAQEQEEEGVRPVNTMRLSTPSLAISASQIRVAGAADAETWDAALSRFNSLSEREAALNQQVLDVNEQYALEVKALRRSVIDSAVKGDYSRDRFMENIDNALAADKQALNRLQNSAGTENYDEALQELANTRAVQSRMLQSVSKVSASVSLERGKGEDSLDALSNQMEKSVREADGRMALVDKALKGEALGKEDKSVALDILVALEAQRSSFAKGKEGEFYMVGSFEATKAAAQKLVNGNALEDADKEALKQYRETMEASKKDLQDFQKTIGGMRERAQAAANYDAANSQFNADLQQALKGGKDYLDNKMKLAEQGYNNNPDGVNNGWNSLLVKSEIKTGMESIAGKRDAQLEALDQQLAAIREGKSQLPIDMDTFMRAQGAKGEDRTAQVLPQAQDGGISTVNVPANAVITIRAVGHAAKETTSGYEVVIEPASGDKNPFKRIEMHNVQPEQLENLVFKVEGAGKAQFRGAGISEGDLTLNVVGRNAAAHVDIARTSGLKINAMNSKDGSTTELSASAMAQAKDEQVRRRNAEVEARERQADARRESMLRNRQRGGGGFGEGESYAMGSRGYGLSGDARHTGNGYNGFNEYLNQANARAAGRGEGRGNNQRG
jgi:hypothetical protein